MEHVQPLQRSFPWRAAALAALGLALAELAMLAVMAGPRILAPHATAADTRLAGTRPVAATGHVRTGPVTPVRSRSHVSVLVLNGNGATGAAGHAATQLLHHGYRSASAADAPSHDYATSLVLYRPGWQREAQRLAHDSGVRVIAPLDGRLPGGSGRDQLVLILGR